MAEDVKVFDWDDEIVNDGNETEFVTLEPGDYDFTVVKFERGTFTPKPGGKTPACNQAIVTLKISTDKGDCFIQDKFPMASTMEWKISAFFRSIGMKKHGEPAKVDFDKLIGSKGRCHVTERTYTKQDGTEGRGNNIGNYLEPPKMAW